MNIESLRVKDLEFVLRLSNAKSIRELARQISVDPQNLNKRLIKIEKCIGIHLFERSPHGITLNEEGMLVLDKFSQALELIKSARNIGSGKKKRICVSGRSYLIDFFINECIGELSNYESSFVDQSPELTERYGRMGLSDIVISHGDLLLGDDWSKVLIGTCNWIFVVGSHHQLAKSKKVIDNLNQNPVIGFSYLRSDRKVAVANSYIEELNATPGHNSQNTKYSISIVKQTNSIAFVPEIAVRYDLKNKSISKLQIPSVKYSKEVYLHFHIDRVPFKISKKVTSLLKTRLKN